MKLSRIYANKPSFKEINFNEGVNVIIGKVTNFVDSTSNTHNLGKTTLIDVIDFLLLKGVSKSSIFKKHQQKFIDHTFYLEIKLNSGKYATIKRSVVNNSKVSIKLHNEKFQDFRNDSEWDYDELMMSSKDSTKNAIAVLNGILGFDVLEKYMYRKTVGYFLRAQQDYDDVFKLHKFAGRHKDWKPMLFDLFQMNGDLLYKKYEYEESLDKKKELIKEIQANFSFETDDLDKVNGLIQSKEIERNELQEDIDQFNFYYEESKINQDIVERLERNISELNSSVYKHRFELNKINESLESKQTFSLNDVESIFNDVEIYFSEQLKHSYAELVTFNKAVTDERSKYLMSRKQELVANINEEDDQLLKLSEERVQLLSVIREADSFKKFKEHQKTIVRIEEELAKLRAQTENLDVLKKLKEEILETGGEIKKKESDIEKEIEKGGEFYSRIRETFIRLTRKILHSSGIISIYQNDEGNVEFNADVSDLDGREITSKGEGFTYKKILCACFDLSVLTNYAEKSFFKFVYHDGVIENYDNRLKLSFLELIHELCDKYDVQYILTLIEDESPVDSNGKRVEFDKEEIVLTLTDEKDNSGRLFGFEF